MRRFVVCAGAFALGVVWVAASAGPAGATNGYQLIGVGHAQKAVGGAVTAAPTDTMTAITNPAGMARVGQRADFSMEAFMPTRSVDFSGLNVPGEPNTRTEGGSELYGVPSVGWVAKAFNRDNVYFGGGMFATSGLGADFDEVVMQGTAASGLPSDVTFNGFSAIQFWKMAPTVAWDASDRTTLGVSLNLDYQSLTIRQKIGNMPFWDAPPGPSTITQRDVNFDLGRPTSQMGLGATFGVLHDVSDRVTIGASYATKQVFRDGEFRLGAGDIENYGVSGAAPAGTYKFGLDYPRQAAFGLAVRPNDRLLVDLDVKWINWSDTHDVVLLKGPTATIPLHFGWDDQVIYALGAHWRATDKLTLRAGFNYAKSPIDEADVMNNMIFPALVERHLTFGFAYQLGDHWGVGGTYMKAFKNSLTGRNDVPQAFQDGTPFMTDSNIRISLEETSIGILVHYLFG